MKHYQPVLDIGEYRGSVAIWKDIWFYSWSCIFEESGSKRFEGFDSSDPTYKMKEKP